MAKYKLLIKKSVVRDLKGIPNADVARILMCFQNLAEDPRGSGAVKLSEQERYRVRVGLYRILYEIQDDVLIITVVKVAHRKEVYR